MALTADVPKIARVAGLGVVKLAAASGRPICVIAIATSRRITLKNWDRTTVHLPFGRGAILGELLSVIPLIERLHAKGFAVLCTSGTVTSANVASERLPDGVIHQYVPIDAPRFVARFFNHWRPDLALFVESELWPNRII